MDLFDLGAFVEWLATVVRKATLMAGAAGVLMGIVARRQFHWAEALTAAGAGFCSVLFVAPAVVRLAGLKGIEEVENLAAWGAGLGGMYIVDFAFKVFRDPLAFWSRIRGGGGGGAGGTP